MRFRRLTVRNYKGITEETLEFPTDGVLVVEGPNEAGKSSLMEAVDLLLEFKDSSGHKRVLEAHPVGEDEAPSVELEAELGPYRFTYAKRWARRGGAGGRGRGGTTTLAITAPRTSHHTGAEAHEKVTSMLEEHLDRSLWSALRLMQGSELGPVRLDSSAALRSALDSAAGAGADTDGEGDSILEAVRAEYERYHTPSTGKPRGEHERVLRRTVEAREADAQARAAVAEVERDTVRHAELVTQIDGLTQRVVETESERDALAAERDRAIEMQERLRESERALAEAARAEKDADAAAQRRTELVEDVGSRTAEMERLRARLQDLQTEAGARDEAAAIGRAALEQAEAYERAAAQAVSRARAQRRRAALLDERAALHGRLTRVEELSAQIAAVKGRLNTLRVDAAALRRVEEAERALDRATVAQRAASATVVGRALAEAVTVRLDDAEVELTPEQTTWTLTEPLTVTVPGVAEFRLVPEAGASDRAAEVEGARRRLAACLTELEVESPEAARRVAAERAELTAEAETAATLRESALDGARLTDLRDRLAELDASTAEGAGAGAGAAEETLADGVDSPDSHDDGSAEFLDRLERDEKAAVEGVRRARAHLESVRRSAEEARTTSTAVQTEVAIGERELGVREEQLAAARAVSTDEEIALARTHTQASLALAVREQAQAAQSALAADGGQERFDAAERAASRARERLDAAGTELLKVEAVLAQAGGQGRAERADRAATDLEAALREENVITRRARAARVLYEALRQHADEARAAYMAPFTEAVERLGTLVYGPTFRVEVEPDLTIAARVLHGVDVPFDQLSSGAKEQLSILVRLAVAGLVDPAGGVPVVIDDALGYSDPQRIVATTAAFEHVASSTQVVMLTCTPGRYDGVRGAQIVRLRGA